MLIELIEMNDGIGFCFPQDIAERNAIQAGDKFYVFLERDAIKLVPCDDELAKQLEIVERGMKKYASALKKLSES